MYDIYVFFGCKVSPDIEDLMVQVPALADPRLQKGLLRDSFHSGFLGLDLPEDVALTLLQRFIAADASCQRCLSDYRQPRIPIEQAKIIAEQTVVKQQTIRVSEKIFDSVSCVANQPMFWNFKVISEQKVFFVGIDKLDGHVWQEEAIKSLDDETDLLRLGVLRARAKAANLPILHWHHLFDVYDVYLLTGCSQHPDVDDFAQDIPQLADPLFQAQILQRSSEPGFLGLNLSMDLAARLLRRLKSVGGRGYRLPSAYRQPRISLEQARAIASGVIANRQSLRTNHTVGSLSLLWDRAMHWVFCAPWEPPVTVEGGGMFCVNVDKLDGHIWTPEERDLLAAESYWERER